MKAALEYLVPLIGVRPACLALGYSPATYYRARRPAAPRRPRPKPRRALSDAERAEVLAVLDSDEFCDKAPLQVYAELLDQGRYLCSPRTMYRVLAEHGQVRERRNLRRHPEYKKPRLVAYGPNQVWSWDITKVPGPRRGVYFSLYVALDIFSRYVVGWTIAHTESAAIAGAFLSQAVQQQAIEPGQLVCHADRGSPMVAKSTALLFADLGIAPSFSRPRVSDDNPYSEAAFKTFLYRPEMPERFGSLEDARSFFAWLFDWYNQRHYHTGIALLTPAVVHAGRGAEIIASRQVVLEAAFMRHPERFACQPRHPSVPEASWINPPETSLPYFP